MTDDINTAIGDLRIARLREEPTAELEELVERLSDRLPTPEAGNGEELRRQWKVRELLSAIYLTPGIAPAELVVKVSGLHIPGNTRKAQFRMIDSLKRSGYVHDMDMLVITPAGRAALEAT